MSYETAIDSFVTPMRRRFTVPAGIDQKAFLDDMGDALGEFSSRQLSNAAAWFRDNRDQRTFPTIAECKRACEMFPDVAQAQRARQHFENQAEKDALRRAEWERRVAAFKLCRSHMGRQADREGWLVALLDFCQDNGRLPQGFEVAAVQKLSRRSEEELERMRLLPPDEKGLQKVSPYYLSLVQLRKDMQERAHREVFRRYEELQAAE